MTYYMLIENLDEKERAKFDRDLVVEPGKPPASTGVADLMSIFSMPTSG